MKKIMLLILMVGLSINLIAISKEVNEKLILNKLSQSANKDTVVSNESSQSVNEDIVVLNEIKIKERVLAIFTLISLSIILSRKKDEIFKKKIFKNQVFKNSAKWYGIGYFLVIIVFACLYNIFTPNLIISWESYTLMTIPNIFKLFLVSLYYSVVTITTLGFGDISPNNLWSMLFTLVESLLGIMFIGLFLNSLSHERSSREEREKENIRIEERKKENINNKIMNIEKILRYDKFLNISNNLNHFCIIIKFLTTPISKYKSNIENDEWSEDFELKDLCELFGPIHMESNNGLMESKIEVYIREEKKLNSQIEKLLLDVNLEIFPKLEISCSEILKKSNEYNRFNAILASKTMSAGKDPFTKIEQEIIKEYNKEPKFEPHVNMINKYIALYFQIKSYLCFKKVYFEEINNIKLILTDLKKSIN